MPHSIQCILSLDSLSHFWGSLQTHWNPPAARDRCRACLAAWTAGAGTLLIYWRLWRKSPVIDNNGRGTNTFAQNASWKRAGSALAWSRGEPRVPCVQELKYLGVGFASLI